MTGADRVITSGLVGKVLAIHRALDRAAIGHGFGGAISLAYATEEPRATDDIDINISIPPDQAERVLDALPAGIEAKANVIDVIGREGQDRLRWGDTPVDLFFPQHEFHRVVAERTRDRPFLDTVIPVISATDLVVFKTMFNRTRDWPDIEAVLRAGTANESEILRWTEAILGADSPARARLVALVHQINSSSEPAAAHDPNPWQQLRRAGKRGTSTGPEASA